MSAPDRSPSAITVNREARKRMSASAHVGPGASDVARGVAQAAAILEALDYGTPTVMFDGYRLVRTVLMEAVDAIDEAILLRLKAEADDAQA